VKITNIYSKIQPEVLLHVVAEMKNPQERENIIPENNFIQCSVLKLHTNKTFRPHRHIFKSRCYENQIAQESWVVIKGSVKCIFYDLDDTIIATPILYHGDASFTLQGGHTYEILEDDTIVYEFKTGPYEGQEMDKVFIKDD